MGFFKKSKKIIGVTLASALISFSSLSCAQSKQFREARSLEGRINSIYIAENTLHEVMDKLEVFRETGNFNVFHDVEANKRHILGLENAVGLEWEAKSGVEKFHDVSSIKIGGKEQYNYYNNKCFVVTQLIYNYLQSKNVKSYILYIESSDGKKILPKYYPREAVKKGKDRIEWAYHTVNVIDFNGKRYVLDPSCSSRAKLLEDYVNRFENPEKLKIHVFEAKRYLEDFMHGKRSSCYPYKQGCNLEEKISLAEDILKEVMNKLEIFRETGNFEIFYGVESNRNILGLEHRIGMEKYFNDSSIKIDGKEQYNYHNKWCFVVAQLIDNNLKSKNIDAYILLIRGKKFEEVLPKDYPEVVVEKWGNRGRIWWSYHMVNVVGFDGKKYVLDPSHSNKAKLLEDYIHRFENPEELRLSRFRTKEELDLFLHPVDVFRPKTMMPLEEIDVN